MTITTEEAERLAQRLETKSWRHGYPVVFYPEPSGGVFINGVFRGNTAAALRSLAAERDALQARVAELEKQNDMLRHATDKLRAMFTELNARHEPLQRAFITAVELLNDAALEGKKDE